MPNDDVPDSTDWLSTPLSGLASVEAALRCQVCKDFYKTPMITSCSHTFCSLCIRRALSNDGKCPLCRASEQELKLRCNWSVEETAEAFAKARATVLDFATSTRLRERSPKRKADHQGSKPTQAAPEPKRLRTSARLSKSRTEAAATVAAAGQELRHEEEEDGEEVIQASDDEDADEYVPEDRESPALVYLVRAQLTPSIEADGMVPCPVCDRKMKAWQVFQHLESCPGPSTSAPSTGSMPPFGQRHQRHEQFVERLPALNYSMLKEQALRKKLNELGISSQGPRVLLEKRHREWLTLWNANCDAAQPKKRSELLQDLEIWERTQGGRAPTSGRSIQTAAAIKDKDFDGTAWAAKHDSSFRDLIANARKSRAAAKKTQDDGNTPDKTQSMPREGPGSSISDQDEASKTTAADAAQDPLFNSSIPTEPDLGDPHSEAAHSVALMGSGRHFDAKVAEAPSSSHVTFTSMKSPHDFGPV
ncbi:phospho-2-dehydro-3-deoxyheptonate aldolase [Purpureocillium lavendulum]|uniref:Postreplication repair E3 ubiquitin-protein ligase RAD18 n=1 Tax=Purpureocillium lavendulum TaxID=1247861 RepID=A0AB34FXS3_9HYPO|nr:phospho-2-dehydro-3-deoxyheptonate aldolase [Purpureocillium lavendulum]